MTLQVLRIDLSVRLGRNTTERAQSALLVENIFHVMLRLSHRKIKFYFMKSLYVHEQPGKPALTSRHPLIRASGHASLL